MLPFRRPISFTFDLGMDGYRLEIFRGDYASLEIITMIFLSLTSF